MVKTKKISWFRIIRKVLGHDQSQVFGCELSISRLQRQSPVLSCSCGGCSVFTSYVTLFTSRSSHVQLYRNTPVLAGLLCASLHMRHILKSAASQS